MKKVLLLFLVMLSACTLAPPTTEVLTWPSAVTCMEGEGDIDIAWKKERYSGSFALKMKYPDFLVLEVYGPFGQTLVYVKKERGQFLVIAGDEKSSDETVLRERYGLNAQDLINDLAMRGNRLELPEGYAIERQDYRVLYSQNRRNRRVICWKGGNGSICLTFDEISFN